MRNPEIGPASFMPIETAPRSPLVRTALLLAESDGRILDDRQGRRSEANHTYRLAPSADAHVSK